MCAVRWPDATAIPLWSPATLNALGQVKLADPVLRRCVPMSSRVMASSPISPTTAPGATQTTAGSPPKRLMAIFRCPKREQVEVVGPLALQEQGLPRAGPDELELGAEEVHAAAGIPRSAATCKRL